MTCPVIQSLEKSPVVPLIQATDSDTARRVADALMTGGLNVIEVVLRTDEALSCLEALCSGLDGALVGAGTVLTPQQARQVIERGAQFVVSPGLHPGVVDVAQNAGVPVFPGIATATELQQAWNLGIDTVKFFPAGLSGGKPMLKALASVFRSVRFMPTGGVSASNLGEYLSQPAVIACGGSWLTPADAVINNDFEAITRLANEALNIAQSCKENTSG